jgi:hypothetical protein
MSLRMGINFVRELSHVPRQLKSTLIPAGNQMNRLKALVKKIFCLWQKRLIPTKPPEESKK